MDFVEFMLNISLDAIEDQQSRRLRGGSEFVIGGPDLFRHQKKRQLYWLIFSTSD